MNPTATSESSEGSVAHRYSAAAKRTEAALCCPVNYDATYLEAIPDEIIHRDYGCGDPTVYVRESDTVVDLGSGAGKNCYITAQIVGPAGRVIGVDCNQDMLALARRHQQEVATRLGFANVEFRFGRIQESRPWTSIATPTRSMPCRQAPAARWKFSTWPAPCGETNR